MEAWEYSPLGTVAWALRREVEGSGWEVLLVRNEQRETVGWEGSGSLWLPDEQSGIVPNSNKGPTTPGSPAKGYCTEVSVSGLFHLTWA